MGAVGYSEKLKDPRWQKKRLLMLQSANFRCQSCGETEDTLHVHHVYYEKDRDPWDYPNEVYMVLCDKCHEKWHNLKWGLDRSLCMMTVDQLQKIVGIVVQLSMLGPSDTDIFSRLVTGYHWKTCDEREELDEPVMSKTETSF